MDLRRATFALALLLAALACNEEQLRSAAGAGSWLFVYRRDHTIPAVELPAFLQGAGRIATAVAFAHRSGSSVKE